VVALDPLDPDDGLAFVLSRVPRRDPPWARELVGLLGSLALEQACSYLVQTGMGIGDYVRLFDTRHEQLLLRGAPSDHRNTICTTWHLLFDRVRAASPLAGQLLELTSFLSPDGVPVALFQPLVGPDGQEPTASRGLVRGVPTAWRPSCGAHRRAEHAWRRPSSRARKPVVRSTHADCRARPSRPSSGGRTHADR
jgi:hypothetical protein